MMRANILNLAAAVAALATTGNLSHARNESERLVVHEWGTFTVLQDANGDPIHGVNVNEEPLPGFVHRLAPDLAPETGDLAPALGGRRFSSFQPPRPPRSKGLARAYRLAIMRMETPIIYFYPPQGRSMTVDVSVRFRNGWLSEWYPAAENMSPGYPGALGGDEPGSLRWEGLEVGARTEVPTTDEHVWLAPRQVDSARVRTKDQSEAEQYLFYRGVAQLRSPIRVVTAGDGKSLELFSDLESEITGEHLVEHLWLADIRPGGAVAFRELDPVVVSSGNSRKIAATPSTFEERDYARGNLVTLRKSMHTAIRAAGLFEDEATAMLDTWELSYFKSAGMRVFFVLPDAWTDYQLPLEISEAADIERVMIGRVELVTPAQKRALATIAAGPASSPDWLQEGLAKLPEARRTAVLSDLKTGETRLATAKHFEVPADYRAYLQLGRFRDAIILNRAQHDPVTRQFAWNYGITLQ